MGGLFRRAAGGGARRLFRRGAALLPDDRVLLEVKLPGVCPLWLAHALAEAGAVPVSFSKYGSCYCHHLLREQPVSLKEVFPCA